MLSVWLTRQFTVDMVEHLARMRGGQSAVPLAAEIKSRLGVGISTGLGMAPFIVRRPALLHCWMAAREEALVCVRRLNKAAPEAVTSLHRATTAAQDNAAN